MNRLIVRRIGLGLAALAAASIAAAAADKVAAPEITNPAIRAIINSRESRLGELNRYRANGFLGDNNKALVEVRPQGVDALGDSATGLRRLVEAENNDRKRMFREIAAATGTDLSQLPRIQETYANTLRANARRGEWIQLPNNTWRQKR